jgi:hypothetical protein
MAQYRAEVPGGRRAWPEAVKSRVRAAFSLGVPIKEIAERTTLSYFTILHWIPKEQRRSYRRRRPALPPAPGGDKQLVAASGRFSELAVRRARTPKKIATVTVAKQRRAPVSASAARATRPPVESATVTVTIPGGVVISGVTPEFLTAWLGLAKAGGAR